MEIEQRLHPKVMFRYFDWKKNLGPAHMNILTQIDFSPLISDSHLKITHISLAYVQIEDKSLELNNSELAGIKLLYNIIYY